VRQKDYIHGFGRVEEQRLRDQAATLAPVVFSGVRLPERGALLEIGCGVGAELDLIGRRFPRISLFGVDLSDSHIDAAARHLAGRARLVQANGAVLPFADASFDVAMTIWLLEHVPRPERVISEALRVLVPGGRLILTEVDNATFRFWPEQPAIRVWWDRFCEQQQRAGADPRVGRSLPALVEAAGGRELRIEDLPVVSSVRERQRRGELIDYVRQLLLSGRPMLERGGVIDASALAALERDFERVRRDSSIQFEYHAVRLSCRAPLATA
jgi:ubiquinone/menaquinone biosynthesis C-methylase UbiE